MLALRRDWPIPVDSAARLQSSGLLADVSIAIREGRSGEAIKPGGELPGVEGADLFAAMNELAGQVSELTRNQISPLIQTLSQRVDSITGTIDRTTPAILEQTRGLLERTNRWEGAAMQWMAAGEPSRALDALEHCVKARTTYLGFTGQSPCFRPLHDDPRFQGVLRALRLEGRIGRLMA